jgi:apolipoprotein N-acyltransferase
VTSVVREPTAAAGAAERSRADRPWGRWALAVAAGLMLYGAFPPLGWWPLALLGVAGLGLSVRGLGPRAGAVCGLLCGLAFFLPLLTWAGSIAGPGAWIALAVLETAFFALLGAALALVSRLPVWPLWSAAVWTAQEALRDRQPFGGFPWGRLAFSQDASPLTPLVALGGAPWLTFVVALLGSLLAAAVLRPARAHALLGAAVATALVGLALVVPTPTDGDSLRVAVVQGNVPRNGLDVASQRSAVLSNHVAATRELAARVRSGQVPRPDVVLWPENASDLDPYTDPEVYRLIDDVVREIGVPVLVGALVDNVDEPDKIDNSGIAWDPATGPGERYVKQHPVPFGEYIPFRSAVRKITSKVDLVPQDFASGDRTGVLDLGPARIGDVICFEVAYDGVVRDAVRGGGRLLVVQTNNATFGRSGETTQQLAMSRLRAVELGRSVVVAATSGESAVIAPDGRLLHRTSLFTRDITVQQVPLRSGRTVALRVGAWPELLLSLLALGAVVVGVRR